MKVQEEVLENPYGSDEFIQIASSQARENNIAKKFYHRETFNKNGINQIKDSRRESQAEAI